MRVVLGVEARWPATITAAALAMRDLIGRLGDDRGDSVRAQLRVWPREEYALAAGSASGRSAAGLGCGTDSSRSIGNSAGEPFACPGVTAMTSGRPKPSTSTRVFVVRPPRDQPMACCPVLMHPHHRRVHADLPVNGAGHVGLRLQHSHPRRIDCEPVRGFHTVCHDPNSAGRSRQAMPVR